MASVSREPNGRKTVQVVCPDGKRRSIRLGKATVKDAQLVCSHVERLVAARISGRPPEDQTSIWLTGAPGKIIDSLHKCGLVDKGRSESLGSFLDRYAASREGVKSSTRAVWRQFTGSLIKFAGPDRPVNLITERDAANWRAWLSRAGLSENTIRKRTAVGKMMFKAAVREGLCDVNPFAELPSATRANRERDHFVTREVAERVLLACPDDEWRLLFALSRYGGLRCPSEHLALHWDHVDWEGLTIDVQSPKTEHHDGGESRVVPLFPELVTPLSAVYAESGGDGPVITRYRNSNSNLRTQLTRIIRRAGLEPWPKLFHNLRASRETELVEAFPLHVACAWIGNSEAVAMRHYLQVHDEHLAKAVQKITEHHRRSMNASPVEDAETPEQRHGSDMGDDNETPQVGDEGLEPIPRTEYSDEGYGELIDSGGAQSGAVEPGLASLCEAWPSLPERLQGLILRIAGVAFDP